MVALASSHELENDVSSNPNSAILGASCKYVYHVPAFPSTPLARSFPSTVIFTLSMVLSSGSLMSYLYCTKLSQDVLSIPTVSLKYNTLSTIKNSYQSPAMSCNTFKNVSPLLYSFDVVAITPQSSVMFVA